MRKFWKEWIDAAATAAGAFSGLPYEPVTLDDARNDNARKDGATDDRQMVFRFADSRGARAA